MTIWQAIAVGLVVAAIAGTFKFLAPRVKGVWLQWRRRRAAAAAARKGRREREARERALAEKIAAATVKGELVVISRRGSMPVEVTYSDGNTSYFFRGDWDAYKVAIGTGRYDPRRTFPFNPPRID
ncbi:hypothetical protein [Rhodococcus sp. USK13]|uniref:hypothetical protein n=1 Tax=Rhodococcus sp. USK13 TaxID=2806442 RepID=UPI001BCD711A|nr:hypothetical protein [Rhodococcus sp. USK13]